MSKTSKSKGDLTPTTPEQPGAAAPPATGDPPAHQPIEPTRDLLNIAEGYVTSGQQCFVAGARNTLKALFYASRGLVLFDTEPGIKAMNTVLDNHNAKGEFPANRLADVISRFSLDGESVLSKERRAEYGAALSFFKWRYPGDADADAAVNEVMSQPGGIGRIAAEWREHDQETNETRRVRSEGASSRHQPQAYRWQLESADDRKEYRGFVETEEAAYIAVFNYAGIPDQWPEDGDIEKAKSILRDIPRSDFWVFPIWKKDKSWLADAQRAFAAQETVEETELSEGRIAFLRALDAEHWLWYYVMNHRRVEGFADSEAQCLADIYSESDLEDSLEDGDKVPTTFAEAADFFDGYFVDWGYLNIDPDEDEELYDNCTDALAGDAPRINITDAESEEDESEEEAEPKALPAPSENGVPAQPSSENGAPSAQPAPSTQPEVITPSPTVRAPAEQGFAWSVSLRNGEYRSGEAPNQDDAYRYMCRHAFQGFMNATNRTLGEMGRFLDFMCRLGNDGIEREWSIEPRVADGEAEATEKTEAEAEAVA